MRESKGMHEIEQVGNECSDHTYPKKDRRLSTTQICVLSELIVL